MTAFTAWLSFTAWLPFTAWLSFIAWMSFTAGCRSQRAVACKMGGRVMP